MALKYTWVDSSTGVTFTDSYHRVTGILINHSGKLA